MNTNPDHDEHHAPGGRYRWTVLVVGAGAQAVAAAFFQGLASIGPALRAQLGLSLTELGLLLACPTVGLLLTLIGWGRLSDSYGERSVMTLGLLGTAGILGTASQVHSPQAIGVLLVAAGACVASVNAASGRAVMVWFPQARRGLAMGVRQCAVPLGAGVAALVLPHLSAGQTPSGGERGDVSQALLTLAVASAAAAAAVAIWIREPSVVAASKAAVQATVSAPTSSVLRDKRFGRLALASGLLVLPQFALLALLVELLHERKGVQPVAAAGVLAIAQVGGAAGRLTAGWWSDRTGTRLRPLRHVAAALAVAAVVLMPLVAAPAVVLAVALIAAASLASCWNGLAFTAAGELAPPGRAGTALGAQNSANFLAASIAPPLFAAIVSAAGWPTGLGLLAVTAATAAVLLTPLVEPVPFRTHPISVRT